MSHLARSPILPVMKSRIYSQGGRKTAPNLESGGLDFSICKAREFNKIMPKALSGLRTTNEHVARRICFVLMVMTYSRLSTLGRQSFLTCNRNKQPLRSGTPVLLRRTVQMTGVLSPSRSRLVLPWLKTPRSHRVCHLWIPSNPSSQGGILHLKILLFLGQQTPAPPTPPSVGLPKTKVGINLSQVELEEEINSKRHVVFYAQRENAFWIDGCQLLLPGTR